MKTLNTLITVLAVIILASCSTKENRTVDDILNSSFRVYQISGFQRPNIDINKDRHAQFLVSLHYDIPFSDIENELNSSSE